MQTRLTDGIWYSIVVVNTPYRKQRIRACSWATKAATAFEQHTLLSSQQMLYAPCPLLVCRPPRRVANEAAAEFRKGLISRTCLNLCQGVFSGFAVWTLVESTRNDHIFGVENRVFCGLSSLGRLDALPLVKELCECIEGDEFCAGDLSRCELESQIRIIPIMQMKQQCLDSVRWVKGRSRRISRCRVVVVVGIVCAGAGA